jgi:MFS family permease
VTPHRPSRARRVGLEFSMAFRSLRRRNYRLFWLGQMTSMIGTWAGEVALAWLVLSLTDSPAMLGLSITVRFLPSTILSLFGGVFADRFAKRPVLIVTQSGQLLVALTLALLTTWGDIGITAILVLAALRGVMDSLDMPARQSFVVEMVGTEDVANAVALNSLQFNVARIVGPVLGAALIGTIGIAACFYLNAATFVVVIGSLVALRTAQLHLAPPRNKAPILKQLREAFAFSYRTPDIMVIFLLVFAVGTFGYNFMTVLPLLAKYVLDSGPAGLGALTSSLGVGSMLAAMWMASRGTPSRRLLLGAAACFSLLLMLLGLFRLQVVAMGLLVGLGLCGILFMTTANTRLQLLSPDSLRGRVMGVYTWLFMGMGPLGSLLVGWLAEWSGVQPMILETAGATSLGVVVAMLYARRNRDRLVTGFARLSIKTTAEDKAA